MQDVDLAYDIMYRSFMNLSKRSSFLAYKWLIRAFIHVRISFEQPNLLHSLREKSNKIDN